MVLKYSKNTPLNKILLGQSKESHTGEKNAPNLSSKDRLSKEIENLEQEHGFELWSEDISGEGVKWRVER
jgi:hypothetical protein